MTDKQIIECTNIDVFQAQRCVFKNFSLTVSLGEKLAIIGPNGCGKSTLLKVFSRELYPAAKANSSLKLFSQQHINVAELRQRIGVLTHSMERFIDQRTTVLEAVLSGIFGVYNNYQHLQITPSDLNSAQRCIELHNLTSVKDQLFHQLSQGYKQRVLLARALINEPKLLIIDEPTNAMDIKAKHDFLNHLDLRLDQHLTTILVTHHIDEITPAFNRVIGLSEGQIQFDLTRDQALTQTHLTKLFNIAVEIEKRNNRFFMAP